MREGEAESEWIGRENGDVGSGEFEGWILELVCRKTTKALWQFITINCKFLLPPALCI